MKKLLPYTALPALSLIALWFLLDSSVRESARDGLSLCARSVIPALFPFMVISSAMLSMGLGELLSGPLGGLMSLYGIDGVGASALVLGLLGGYPLGARTAAELYRSRLLSRDEAQRLLSFCNNGSPAFLITVLGEGIFGSFRAGVWLWLIHITAALITGLFLGRASGRKPASPFPRRPVFRAARPDTAFVSAVQSALQGTLGVCAFVVMFTILTTPFRTMGSIAGALLSGLLELFSALPAIPATRAGFVLASGLAGWGGVSVLCQTAVLLTDTDLTMARCAAGKALQGLLAAALAALLSGFVFG